MRLQHDHARGHEHGCRRQRGSRGGVEEGHRAEQEESLKSGVRDTGGMPRERAFDPEAHEQQDDEGGTICAGYEYGGPATIVDYLDMDT